MSVELRAPPRIFVVDRKIDNRIASGSYPRIKIAPVNVTLLDGLLTQGRPLSSPGNLLSLEEPLTGKWPEGDPKGY